MFILINAASLLFIVISYLRMLQAIRGSGEAMRSTLSGRESVVATRYSIIFYLKIHVLFVHSIYVYIIPKTFVGNSD